MENGLRHASGPVHSNKFGPNFIVNFRAIFDLATLTQDSVLGSNDPTQELSGGVILLCAVKTEIVTSKV